MDMKPEIVALANAVAALDAVYQWIDQIEDAGGATSIAGVAKCNAFLKSMNGNRKRFDKLIIQPAREAVAKAKTGGDA